MSQDYYAFNANDIVKNAMPLLYKYISSIASVFSGRAFPTQGLTQGMLCYRTDQEKLYQLKALPSTWVLIADLKRDITHASTADRATNATSANNADTVDGKHATDGAGQIALKDGSNDLNCRLVRQSYQDQGSISGGLVFRINNSSDNYLRVCNNAAAIRNFLGLGNVNNTADSQKSVNYAASAGNAQAATKLQMARTINGVAFDGTKNIEILNDGLSIDSRINVSGSTETNWSDNVRLGGASGEGFGYVVISGNTLTRVAGIAPGTYTLRNLLQQLVSKSHTHGARAAAGAVNCGNCNCNCDNDSDGE